MQHLLMEGLHTAARDWRHNPYPICGTPTSDTILRKQQIQHKSRLTLIKREQTITSLSMCLMKLSEAEW